MRKFPIKSISSKLALAMCAVLALTFILVGCGQSPEDAPAAGANASAPPPAPPAAGIQSEKPAGG